jgi:hypothetical protein
MTDQVLGIRFAHTNMLVHLRMEPTHTDGGRLVTERLGKHSLSCPAGGSMGGAECESAQLPATVPPIRRHQPEPQVETLQALILGYSEVEINVYNQSNFVKIIKNSQLVCETAERG